jgi:hypothetical protein
VQDFIWAKSTCKRWLRVGYQITIVDWAFDDEDAILSLVNFLQHGAVSLTELNLYTGRLGLDSVAYRLVFTSFFKSRIPPVVRLYFIPAEDGSDEGGLFSVDDMVYPFFSCPALREFAFFNNPKTNVHCGLEPYMELVNSQVQKLELVGLCMSQYELQTLLRICPRVTELRALEFEGQLELEGPLELDYQSVKTLALRPLGESPKVCRIRAQCLTELQADIGSLILDTPALQKLSLRVANSEVDFKSPVQLQDLCLQQIGSKESWQACAVPILRTQNPHLRHLKLRGCHTPSSQAVVSLEELLAVIPSRLESLSLEDGFFEVIGYDIPKPKLLPHLALKTLVVELKSETVEICFYVKVKELKRALPKLNSLEIKLAPNTSKIARYYLEKETQLTGR